MLGAGCSLVRCMPSTIVVADTQRDDRLERRVESVRVEPVFGRVQEITSDVVATHYWVRAEGGDWIAVDEATWRQAERGRPLEVCR